MTPSRVLGNLARGSGFRAEQSSTGKALGGRCTVACQHKGAGSQQAGTKLKATERALESKVCEPRGPKLGRSLKPQ